MAPGGPSPTTEQNAERVTPADTDGSSWTASPTPTDRQKERRSSPPSGCRRDSTVVNAANSPTESLSSFDLLTIHEWPPEARLSAQRVAWSRRGRLVLGTLGIPLLAHVHAWSMQDKGPLCCLFLKKRCTICNVRNVCVCRDCILVFVDYHWVSTLCPRYLKHAELHVTANTSGPSFITFFHFSQCSRSGQGVAGVEIVRTWFNGNSQEGKGFWIRVDSSRPCGQG